MKFLPDEHRPPLEYECTLVAGHSLGHDWRGIPAGPRATPAYDPLEAAVNVAMTNPPVIPGREDES
jgi:hypothetical protein